MDVVEQVECRATKTRKGLEHPSLEEKLRELGVSSARRKGRVGEMSSMSLNPGWEVSWFHTSQQSEPCSHSLTPHYNRLGKRIQRGKVKKFVR